MCLRSKGLKLSVFKPFSFTSTLFPQKGNIEKHFIFLFQLLFKADSPTFPLRSSKMRDILKIASLMCFKMFSSLADHVFLWARSSAGRAPRSHRGGRGFDPLRVHQQKYHHLKVVVFFIGILLKIARNTLKPKPFLPISSGLAPFRMYFRRFRLCRKLFFHRRFFCALRDQPVPPAFVDLTGLSLRRSHGFFISSPLRSAFQVYPCLTTKQGAVFPCRLSGIRTVRDLHMAITELRGFCSRNIDFSPHQVPLHRIVTQSFHRLISAFGANLNRHQRIIQQKGLIG